MFHTHGFFEGNLSPRSVIVSIVQFTRNGLNLEQQMGSCESQGAILTYPRNIEERQFIWRYYVEAAGIKDPAKMAYDYDWFIHSGYRRTDVFWYYDYWNYDYQFDFVFTSSDGMLSF